MQMKKRVLSVLLALCLAGSLASTAWAAGDQATPETAEADTSAVVLNEEEEQQDETTASQEETSGEDSTAAPAEDPTAQVTETEADDGSVEYTAALETDGQTMNVVVTAPEGAFAEDVQPELSVTMLTADDELNAVLCQQVEGLHTVKGLQGANPLEGKQLADSAVDFAVIVHDQHTRIFHRQTSFRKDHLSLNTE